MSFFNQRGIFLQLMQPSLSEPNTVVSLQLARKELSWDADNEKQVEALVDSVFFNAVSSDGGNSFSIRVVGKDVDGDGDVDADDKAKRGSHGDEADECQHGVEQWLCPASPRIALAIAGQHGGALWFAARVVPRQQQSKA